MQSWTNGFAPRVYSTYFMSNHAQLPDANNQTFTPIPWPIDPYLEIASKLSWNCAPYLTGNESSASRRMYFLMACLQGWGGVQKFGGHDGESYNVLYADGSVKNVRINWQQIQGNMWGWGPIEQQAWFQTLDAYNK
jgi:prepilin-type processing-associated H-X9-DG protein